MEKEIQVIVAMHIIHSVLMVINGTVFELLCQTFHFHAEFFKDAFGGGKFQPINDFLSRHLSMAMKSFLLESCPHNPQEKNRGLKFCNFFP